MARKGRVQAVRTLARQAAPAGIYGSKYTPALGAAICGRLAAGENLRSICRADPAMPTEKTVWNWARSHPGFATMRARAVRQARRAMARTRPSKTGRRAWNRGRSTWSAARAEAVPARLREGEPLYLVCREAGMPWGLGTTGCGRGRRWCGSTARPRRWRSWCC